SVCEHKQHAEGGAPETDRAQQHDESRRTWYQPAGDTHPDQAEPSHLAGWMRVRVPVMVMGVLVRVPVVVVMVVIVRVPVVVVVHRGTAAEDPGEHGRADGSDQDSAGDAEP